MLDRPSSIDLRVVGVVGRGVVGVVLHGIWLTIPRAAMTVDVVDAVLRVVFSMKIVDEDHTLLWADVVDNAPNG